MVERPNISDLDPLQLALVSDAIRLHQTGLASEVLSEVVMKKKTLPGYPLPGSPQSIPVVPKPEVQKKHIKKDGKK